MPAPPKLTYANVFDYLLALGTRFATIGRSELTYDGIIRASEGFPLLVVEGDTQGSDVYRPTGEPAGLESFTVAVQVLAQAGTTAGDIAEALRLTKQWAEALCERIRSERSGQLVAVGWLSLPNVAGEALATGWRVELSLKLYKDLDRPASAGTFAPEV